MASPPAAPAAAPAKTVAIRAPDGSIGTVPHDQLAQALDAGAVVVSPEEFHKAKIQARYGDAAGQYVASTAGLARGLTLGLSDQAAVALGGEEVRQDLAGLQQANPYASVGGEVIGAALPVLAGGAAAAPEEGLSIGRAVRGLGALPRGVAAMGGAAERGALALAGEGLGGRVVAGAARGAVEGAAYGAGGAVSEAALGDHELTAESLLAGAKGGALAGGLLGGGGGLLASALVPRVAPGLRDVEAVAARGLGDASPGLGRAVSEASAFDAAAERYAAKVSDTPEQAKLLSDAWRRRAEVFGSHEELLERSTRQVTEHLDTALKAERAVDLASFGEAKEGQMARLVDSGKWREARDTALGVWQDSKAVIDELMADPTRGGSGVAVSRAQKWLEKFGNEIGAIATAKDKTEVARQLFTQLDDFKRAVGQNAMYGRGPFGLPEAAREFDSLYHRVRSALEDEGVWGRAAVAQREVNAATQARLATRRPFGSTFTTEYGSEAGRPIHVANPEGTATYVRNLTSAKNDLKHRALVDYVTSEEKFLDTVERHYQLTPAQKEQVARAREAFAGLRTTVSSTAREVTTINQLRRLQDAEKAGGLGGLVGLAADVGTRPLRTLQRLAVIEQQTRRINDTLKKGVRVVFGGGAPPPAAPRESLSAEFDRVSKSVRAIAAAGATDSVARATEHFADAAPNTTMHIGVLATRVATFLATKLPAGRTDPESLTPHLDDPRVSDAEKDRFLRYARAANDPTTVVHDLAHGRMSRESAEAFRVIYPKLYAKTQAEILGHLAQQTAPLTYQKELQLRILLGKPLANPAFVKVLEKAIADEPEAKKPTTAPIRFDVDASRSESERIEGD